MVEFKDTPQYILENSLTQGIKKNILPGKKEEWDYRLAYFLKTWSLKNMKYSLLVADQTPFTRGWVLVAVHFSREPPTAFWKGLPKRAWEVMPFFGVACSQWLTDNWKSRSDLLPQGEIKPVVPFTLQCSPRGQAKTNSSWSHIFALAHSSVLSCFPHCHRFLLRAPFQLWINAQKYCLGF